VRFERCAAVENFPLNAERPNPAATETSAARGGASNPSPGATFRVHAAAFDGINPSRIRRFAFIFAALALGGGLMNRMVAPVWADARARQPALQLDSSLAAAGQGITLALLGGFRALVADGTWIRMYDLWERRDLPAVQTLLQLVTALDPRPVYFWLNGARITAHDFAAWRIQAEGGYETVPRSRQQQIDAEQGRQALRVLDAAAAYHPASADLWIERAAIELTRLRDVAAAAESYRRAWEQPNAPYFAARLHAELLRKLGRKSDALAWLTRLHPQLPSGDEAAAAEVVLGRIRDLEAELKVPPAQCYRPAHPNQ